MEDSPQFSNQERTPIYSESPNSPSYLSSNSPHSRRVNPDGSGIESDGEDGSMSHQNASTDSLLNASFSEVESRALELLETPTEESQKHLIGVGGKNYSNATIIDLPRTILTPGSSEEESQYQSTMTYLKDCVAELDETDWMFENRFQEESMRRKIGILGGNPIEQEDSWQDEGFNLESYPAFEEDDSIGQAMKFMDLGPNGLATRQ